MTAYKVGKYFLEKNYFNLNRFICVRLLGVLEKWRNVKLFVFADCSLSGGGRLRVTKASAGTSIQAECDEHAESCEGQP